MRILLIAALAVVGAPVGVIAQTTTPASPSATIKHYTTTDTDIGTLLDNPASKAVVDKYLPGFSSNSQTELAKSMTLTNIQQYSPDTITDKVLSEIDADLAKIPVK